MVDESRIDELYAAPLDGFTQARDALAAELKGAGDKDGAAAVKKLKKPSLAAWAVNQVVHENPDDIERLFSLRESIENARDARELRSASDDRKHLIATLVSRAETVLEEAGRGTAANTVQAITQTFHAGDTDEDREALLRGRLTKELKPGGFGGFGLAFEETSEDDDDAPDPAIERKRQKAEELAGEAAEAEREAARRERDLEEAQRALKKAESALETARKSAEQARRRADKALASLG